MNFFDYLNHQKNEDRRAFCVHYPPMKGKTAFARRVCQSRPDVYLLDLQTYFLEHPDLPPVQHCDLPTLKHLLLSLNVDQPVVLVDNPDFLLNTWGGTEKGAMIEWLRYQLRSPAHTNKTLVFFVQTDGILSAADMRNSYDEPRVLALNDFDAL